MMRPTHTIDDRDPEPRIILELRKLMGVNDVSEVTGNRQANSFYNLSALGIRPALVSSSAMSNPEIEAEIARWSAARKRRAQIYCTDRCIHGHRISIPNKPHFSGDDQKPLRVHPNLIPVTLPRPQDSPPRSTTIVRSYPSAILITQTASFGHLPKRFGDIARPRASAGRRSR